MAFDGVGPVTVIVFLHQLRPYREKADPEPLPVVRELARTYGIERVVGKREGITFARIDVGLVRLRKRVGKRAKKAR